MGVVTLLSKWLDCLPVDCCDGRMAWRLYFSAGRVAVVVEFNNGGVVIAMSGVDHIAMVVDYVWCDGVV